MRNSKKEINTHTVLNIFVLAFVIIISIMNWNIYYTDHSWTSKVSIISVLLLMYQIFMIIKFKVKIYDFRVWFTIFQYLFIFGRIYLNALNLDTNIFWNLMEYYDDISMNRAAFYALIYVQSIYTGMFIFDRTKKVNKKKILENEVKKINNKYETNKTFFIGVMMIILCLPFKIYTDYVSILAQRTSGGYVALAVDNAFFYALGLLLPVGFIYLIVSQKLSKRKLDTVLIMYCIYTIVVMVFSGDRRYAITSFLAIILCYIKTLNIKISVKKIVVYSLVGILVMFILAAIRNARLYVINSFSDFWNMLVSITTESNFLYETLSEFGLTFFIYAAVIKFFPAKFSFKYGTTYLFAPFTTIPMSGAFFPGVQEAVSAHMNCKSITNQSLGAAFGEELYGNFGFAAPFFAILAGIIIAKLMNYGTITDNNSSKKKIINYYCIFYLLINLVRASTTEIFRLVVYALFIPWVIGLLYKGKKRSV